MMLLHTPSRPHSSVSNLQTPKESLGCEMANHLWNLAIWRQSAAACLSLFSSVIRLVYGVWLQISMTAGGADHPTSGWMEGCSTLTVETRHAAPDESRVEYHSFERGRLHPHPPHPPRPPVCRSHLQEPRGVIYPLMTTSWQRTHRCAAVDFIDEWHLKAGINAFFFQKDSPLAGRSDK